MKITLVAACIVGLIVLGGIAYWKLTAQPPAFIEDVQTPATTPPGRVETEELKTQRKLLGVWQDEYQGKRTMTLKDDGTGTMLVELSGVQAVLFAAKLRFDMKWSLKDNKLIKTTIGGEPADKVNLILNTMGNTAEDAILELSDNRLLLLDKNGKTQYDWKRAKTADAKE